MQVRDLGDDRLEITEGERVAYGWVSALSSRYEPGDYGPDGHRKPGARPRALTAAELEDYCRLLLDEQAPLEPQEAPPASDAASFHAERVKGAHAQAKAVGAELDAAAQERRVVELPHPPPLATTASNMRVEGNTITATMAPVWVAPPAPSAKPPTLFQRMTAWLR